jgi:hypothetical protein
MTPTPIHPDTPTDELLAEYESLRGRYGQGPDAPETTEERITRESRFAAIYAVLASRGALPRHLSKAPGFEQPRRRRPVY